MAADHRVVQDDGPLNARPAVDAHSGREHRLADQGPGHDDTVADHAVERTPDPVAVVVHELRRRLGGDVGQDRPPVVVQVELGGGRAEIHVGVEVGIEGADVAPVGGVFRADARHLVGGEVVHLRTSVAHQHRDQVPAEVVPARVIGGVLAQRVHQHVGGEHVVAHGGKGLVGAAGAGRGIVRFLQEGIDGAPVLADADDAELGGLVARHRYRRHGHPGSACHVLVDDLPRVHPVHVVGAHDHHQVWALIVDQVQRLVDRVSGPGVPVRAEPLLGRDGGHVVAQQGAHPPGGGDVPVQAVALVLG